MTLNPVRSKPLQAALAAVVLVCLSLVLCPVAARAGWNIDAARFHVSAHGQMGCTECHESVADEPDAHPDPAKVGTKLAERFDPDSCLACHDSVLDGFEENRHGDKTGINPEDYQKCLDCHDPHYVLKQGDNRPKGFNPSLPPDKQCAVCHEAQKELPAPAEEEAPCLACHRLEPRAGAARTKQVAALCLTCHGPQGKNEKGEKAGQIHLALPLTKNKDHAALDCLTCHPGAAGDGHLNQKAVNCLACHTLHDEKQAGGDAHLRVDCLACHAENIQPVREAKTGLIKAKPLPDQVGLIRIHRMSTAQAEDSCTRCHRPGNKLGAAGMVLPAKSIICLPCHAATFSVGDTTTILSLLVFLVGLIMSASVWLTAGRASGSTHSQGSGGSAGPFLKGFILDGLLQRGLWTISPGRWLIHALIVWPFFIRCGLGLIGLIASLTAPETTWFWALLDKNQPLAALVYDLTGLMVIVGIIAAAIRRAGESGRPADLPGQDRLALGLLGAILVAGFFLEGMRIAMTGAPSGSEYAFIGSAISSLFKGVDLTGVYGYLWYAHAVLTGLFVAYLPFSRMFHIILGPVSAGLAELNRARHGAGK